MEVRRNYRTDPRMETYFQFLEKWDLHWFPNELITAGDSLPGTPEGYEHAIAKAMREYGPTLSPGEDQIKLPAVVARDPYDVYFNNYVEAHYEGQEHFEVPPPPSHIPRPGSTLDIRVDLSYPQDVLEAEIKRELCKAIRTRRNYEKRGLLPSRPQRVHLEKIGFYLKVYDQAAAGQTFRKIAKGLKKRVSTVKSAYLVACRSIFVGSQKPPKRHLPAKAPGVLHDCEKCPVCRCAERPEDLCPVAKAYAGQDQVSQRELPGVDTLRDLNVDNTGKVQGTRRVSPPTHPLNNSFR